MGILRQRRGRSRLVVLMFALVVAGCAPGAAESAGEPVTTAAAPESLPLADVDRDSEASPTSTTTTTLAPEPTIPPDPFRTWIATAEDHVLGLTAYAEPAGAPIVLPFYVPNPHQFGGPLTLRVTEGEPGDEWVRVQLPIRPNGQEGWIRTADYVLSSTRMRAEVDLSDRRVVVYDGPEVVAETDAVIGRDDTPTPLGTFFIAAKKENTDEEYYLGPRALVLSGFSEALDTFSGGLPVIAVHGTHRPEQVGQSLSNGCIRVPNDVIEFLGENVPLGAPITISL